MIGVQQVKLTFEEAYPEAVAKVVGFIHKQKALASFEFACMLNRGIINKVKQGDYMCPPPRQVCLEAQSEECRYKEELSTGVSETDCEDRRSQSSEIQDELRDFAPNGAIFQPQLAEALTDCLDQLKSARYTTKFLLTEAMTCNFAMAARRGLASLTRLKTRSSRTKSKQNELLAVLILAARQAQLPKAVLVQLVADCLNSDNACTKIREIKSTGLYRALVGEERFHKHKVESSAGSGSEPLLK